MNNLYIIDTNIFITAKNQLYPMDIMPRFWTLLIERGSSKTVLIDRVKNELLEGNDDLSQWIKEHGDKFINKTINDIDVINSYRRIIQDVQNSKQYTESAKMEFAGVADSWICAHALAHEYTVVTMEKYSVGAKKRIIIPNICKDYDIRCISLLDYIREIGITFT